MTRHARSLLVITASCLTAFSVSAICSTAFCDPLQPTTDLSPVSHAALAVAQAERDLARAQLNRIESANEKVRRAYPMALVDSYRRRLDWAEKRIAELQQDPSADPFAEHLRHAEWIHATNEDAWKRAKAVHDRTAGAIDRRDLEILRLRANVSRAFLAAGRLAAQGTPEARIAWQLSALRNYLEQIREDSLAKPPRDTVRYRYFIP